MTFKPMKFRVESPAHSEKIQKVLFDLGYSWCGNKQYQYTDSSFLWVKESGQITQMLRKDEVYFVGTEEPEYTLKEIISYELVPVQKPEELIELNGLKYKKAELEEALKLIKPIE